MFEKKLTVYPAYGYQPEGGDAWRIPVRAWVRNERPLPPDALIRLCVDEEGDLDERTLLRFKECLKDFWARDNEGESVSFEFDDDPDGETFRLDGETDENGLLVDELPLPAERARRLLAAQASDSGRGGGVLKLTARTRGLSGEARAAGTVRLVEPEGLSVVSDIDDTIKVSEITAGKRTALRRAFLMDYEATEGMRDRYLNILAKHPQFDNVTFHYVSGSPWQLFRLLHAFLVEKERFPAGTFHMKGINVNLEDLVSTFGDVGNLLAGAEHTEGQKVKTISELMEHLPRRRFVLVGDTGERDPEVFRAIKQNPRLGDRVLKIYIRDVTELGEGAERLDGMLRIDLRGKCLVEEGE